MVEPFPDFATLSDDELKELIAKWEAEANELSYQLRLLQDGARAERTARRKAKAERLAGRRADIEEALLRAFIAPERRSRYLTLLGTPAGRGKLLKSFVHMKDLDPRFAHGIRGVHDAVSIYDDLRRRGAPERCYVMSASNDLDGQETDLLSALWETVGDEDGTFISCLPGQLAYFESEYGQFILERPA